MLTKSQQVRQYQDTRIASAGKAVPRFDKFKPMHPVVKVERLRPERKEPEVDLFKYSPDQPRDEQGRWTAGGIAAAALGATAAGLAGVAAYRNRSGIAEAARRMFGLTTPKATTAASGPRSTKPYSSLSPRQQRRREATARAAMIERGATKEQADAMVRRMREQASIKPAEGGSRALTVIPPKGGLTPDMVAFERARVDSMKDEFEGLFRQFNALTGKGEPTRQARLAREMDTLRDKISARERDLIQNYGPWKRTPKPTPAPPPLQLAPPKPSSRRLTVSERLRGRTRGEKRASAGTLFDNPLAKYRPDQERDREGQFADEGGGRGSGSRASTREGARGASAGPAPRKPRDMPDDIKPEAASDSSGNWALARDIGINAALIGATIYGGPAVSAGGRAAARGGRRVGQTVTDLYNRLRQRRRLLA